MVSYEEAKEALELTNPYEFQGRIKKPELFVDRVGQLHEARVACEQIALGRTGGVLVIGGKGAGKTSFLEALHRELDGRRIANTVLPLDETMMVQGKEAKLFKTMLSELTAAAQLSGLLDAGLSSKLKSFLGGLLSGAELGVDVPGLSVLVRAAKEEEYSDFGYIMLRDGLRDYKKLIEGGNGSTKGAILLLDEGDGLLLNRNLLQLFRNVLQDMEGIGLVVAGTSRLQDKVSEIFSPISRFFRPIELGPFDSEEDVLKTIGVGLNLVEKEMARKKIPFTAVHQEFDESVVQLSGGSPYEVNLLSYFAFEEGSRRFQFTGGKVTLYMKLDKNLLDIAFRQLKGRKEYGPFMEALDDQQKALLRLVSQSKYGTSLAELVRLSMLDDASNSIESVNLNAFIGKDTEFDEYDQRVQSGVKSIERLAEKFAIPIFSVAVRGKPIYKVEDQWIRASFKYGSVLPEIDMASGIIRPSRQARIYGDPIASIIDTIFLPDVIGKLGAPDSWRSNNFPNDGSGAPETEGRKILNCAYIRTADNQAWHMAYQIRKPEDVSVISTQMEGALEFLFERGLVGDFKVSVLFG